MRFKNKIKFKLNFSKFNTSNINEIIKMKNSDLDFNHNIKNKIFYYIKNEKNKAKKKVPLNLNKWKEKRIQNNLILKKINKEENLNFKRNSKDITRNKKVKGYIFNKEKKKDNFLLNSLNPYIYNPIDIKALYKFKNTSCFASKTKKNNSIDNKDTPSPCQYNIYHTNITKTKNFTKFENFNIGERKFKKSLIYGNRSIDFKINKKIDNPMRPLKKNIFNFKKKNIKSLDNDFDNLIKVKRYWK